jgi:hypothetical protein
MTAVLIWGTAVIALLCALGGMAQILDKEG